MNNMDGFCEKCNLTLKYCTCNNQEPRPQIEIKSQDGPVHKFYGVIRHKHFGKKVLSAEAERDIKEAFFFGFYTAMEFLGKRLPNLEDNVARQLIQDVQSDVNSVILPAKKRVKSNIILPNN